MKKLSLPLIGFITLAFLGLLLFLALSFKSFNVERQLKKAEAQEHGATSSSHTAEKLLKQTWSWNNFGTIDKASAQRGLQVYREVCSTCHSLNRISFRHLSQIGFSKEEIKRLAANYTYTAIGIDGSEIERQGLSRDYFVPPFENSKAAEAANNGKAPPDFSWIVRAREGGANYIYSLLSGYTTPPASFELGPNLHYNKYFSSGARQIGMAEPLNDITAVEYGEGQPEGTKEQNIRDVVTFLYWASNPMHDRYQRLGLISVLFAFLFALLSYVTYRSVANRAKH